MTELLEQAIAKVRELPDDRQDAVADALFAHLAGDERSSHLTDDQVAEVRRIQQRLAQGATRAATPEEMDALWKTCGL